MPEPRRKSSDIELGTPTNASAMSQPLQSSSQESPKCHSSSSSIPVVKSSDAARSVLLQSPDAAELPTDKEALKAEISGEVYGDWVTEVMQRGKARQHWVWPITELGKALAEDNAKRLARLNLGIEAQGCYKGYGLAALCDLFPKRFVHTGIQDDEHYICCRRYPELGNSFQAGTEEHVTERTVWWCCLCYGGHYFLAFIGTVVNALWCVFGYVLPNCCCGWRWFCWQAPRRCCFRSYHHFDDIEPQFQTGDIFLFCGTFTTRIGGQSHWSHVGVVLRDDAGDIGPKGLLYVYEANFGRPGWDHCDLRLLKEKILTYKGGATDCAWRPLLGANDASRAKIAKAILHHCGAAYDHHLGHMFLAAMDCCPCVDVTSDANSGQKREMFCSQAVARVLQEGEALPGPPRGPPACEFLPRDFGVVAGCNTESTLLSEILGPLHMIQRAKPKKWTGLALR